MGRILPEAIVFEGDNPTAVADQTRNRFPPISRDEEREKMGKSPELILTQMQEKE